MAFCKNSPKIQTMKKTSAERIEELIEEATIDAKDEEEQLMGFICMFQDFVTTPFKAKAMGDEVEIIELTEGKYNNLVAVCKKNGKTYTVCLDTLEFSDPLPDGYEWIEAFQEWRRWNR